ncbi:fibronectin type III domain-containing protein [Gemmata sp.]|uniref:fibronectin type III domain-containing protein n=1 Tax=Gemmata sp. TaxID=1914242 RepID=UPI003F71FA07
MNSFNRRAFLGTTLGGAAALSVGRAAAAPELAPAPRKLDDTPTNLGPQDTLFLTYSGDPTTTVTVQWIGPGIAAPAFVRHVTRTGTVWTQTPTTTRPFPKTILRVHRAELTGLTPGTEYLLQVGTLPQVHRFRTMPARATDTFTFVSGGDCGVNAHAVANNVLAAKQEPYFAFIGGDLGYDNGASASAALGFVRNYAKHMVDPKGRLIPLVTCLGNHEVKGGYKGKREDATFFFPLFDGLYKDTSYAALDFGDYLSLVLLDTGHVSPIKGEQTDWLETTLRQRAERPHLIAANHVPAYPSFRPAKVTVPGAGILDIFKIPASAGTGEDNRKFWCPLFERHGVDAVLEHHDHTFKRTFPLTDGVRNKYGVPYLGDGSWGQLRAPAPAEKRAYLASVGKAYHFTVHKLEGDQRFHVALEENGRIADVYGTTGKRPAKRG